MGGEFWVKYIYKDKEIMSTLTNDKPIKGENIAIKTERMKKHKFLKIVDTFHSITEERIGKYDKIVREKYVVTLE